MDPDKNGGMCLSSRITRNNYNTSTKPTPKKCNTLETTEEADHVHISLKSTFANAYFQYLLLRLNSPFPHLLLDHFVNLLWSLYC